MDDAQRVKLLESYSSYSLGMCARRPGSPPCRKRNPVECRNCRQRNEATK